MPTSRTQTTGRTSGRTSSRAGSTARNEIIAMLKDDHKRVKKAFREFEKLDPHEDPERCQELVTMTCGDLEVHTTLEEELFYPAARGCLGDEELIDEAEVEHESVKHLIAELRDMSPEDQKYAATFKVLGEYVAHHIREEENEIFPQLANAKFDWQELQAEMIDRRAELMEEIMPEAQQAASSGKEEAESGS